MWLTAHAPFPRNKEKKRQESHFNEGSSRGRYYPSNFFALGLGKRGVPTPYQLYFLPTALSPPAAMLRRWRGYLLHHPMVKSLEESFACPLHRVCLKCPMSFPIGVARDFFSTFLSDPRDQEMVNKPPLSGISRATRPATMSPLCSPAYTLPPGTCLMTCDERPHQK